MHINKPVILLGLLCLSINCVFGQANPPSKCTKDSTFPHVDSLKAALVTAPIRPHMKGDTLEYSIEHLRMQPNSVVEELLRRLPGLHVALDGTITYNGEKIQHLLVDGEDIFGSNPTMVTRNFDAGKITKVQILNRKSDEAIFTGIDDGTRTKTLNLVLKSDAKKGYFGKIEAGTNTYGYYNSNATLAEFRDKEQFTALGVAANTGIVNSGNAGEAQVNFLNTNADPLGASAGIGIPRFDAAALHYANTWNGSGDHLTSNYQYSHYLTQPITNIETIQAQADTIYSQRQGAASTNRQDQHWIFGIYDWAPSASIAFNFTFFGTFTQAGNQYSSSLNSYFNDTMVNSSLRTIRDNVGRQDFGGDLSWRTRLGSRPERVFSISFGTHKIDNTTNGFLYSLDKYYQPNSLLQATDTVDQQKRISSHSLGLVGTISYTEPLWKATVLGLRYRIMRTGDDPLQYTFDKGNGKYQEMVDSLSSHYKTHIITQRGTANLQGRFGPLNYSVGTDWVIYNSHEQDLISDSIQHLYHFNWAPRMQINYVFDRWTNIKFNYEASTEQPSISQLTPIKNNSDPMHITIGNPGLKPISSQNLKLEFQRTKQWLINADLVLILNNNSTSNKTTTDSFGRQITELVNVTGGQSAGLNLSANKKVLGIDLGVHFTGSAVNTSNYINTTLNKNITRVGEGGISLDKYVPEQVSFQLYTNFSYFDRSSSINSTLPVHYWLQSHRAAITLYMIKHFEIGTNVTYTWQQRTSSFLDNTSVLLWNSTFTRNLLNNKLAMKLQVNNIFNQNTGIIRSNVENVNTQSKTNILGRYWLLTLTYHFDRTFKKK